MSGAIQHISLPHLVAAAHALRDEPQVDMPVKHSFTPGLYARTIFMPKGTLVVSKIHKTEHPYVITKGHAAVWTEAAGVVHLKAGHIGITKPGTCRLLLILEDCEWTTFHPTPHTDVDKIEAEIIEPFPPAIPDEAWKQLKEEN